MNIDIDIHHPNYDMNIDTHYSIVKEVEELKAKLTNALNTVTEEAGKRAALEGDKQELLDALCLMLDMVRHNIVCANSYAAVEIASEIARKHITKPFEKIQNDGM